MEQKREINKKLSWVFTVISIGELAGALAVVAYGLLKGHMTGTTCNVIMALHWYCTGYWKILQNRLPCTVLMVLPRHRRKPMSNISCWIWLDSQELHVSCLEWAEAHQEVTVGFSVQ